MQEAIQYGDYGDEDHEIEHVAFNFVQIGIKQDRRCQKRRTDNDGPDVFLFQSGLTGNEVISLGLFIIFNDCGFIQKISFENDKRRDHKQQRQQ